MTDHARCGCCTDTDILEPIDSHNPPGQPALRRRVGTHGSFAARLRAELSRHPSTRGLTTREPDDLTIALLDAWAVAADNLTFYTERFANEHYVGTAVERRSLAELARLIGRRLRPALAAEAHLAFTMDATPGAPDRLALAAGTPVQSNPEPGADPAVYETLERREIRPAWNRLRAKASTTPKWVHENASVVHLAGASTGVAPGDMIVYRTRLWAAAAAVVTAVSTTEEVLPTPGDPGRPAVTTLTVRRLSVVGSNLPIDAPLGAPTLSPSLTGAAAWLDGRVLTSAELDAEAAERRVRMVEIEASLSGRAPTPGTVRSFRVTSSLFGATAPQSSSLARAMRAELLAIGDAELTQQVNEHVSAELFPWDGATAATMPGGSGHRILLDAEHPTVAPDSVAVITDGSLAGIYRVDRAATGSFASDGISGKTTRLDLHASTGLEQFPLRETRVHAGSAELTRAPTPDESAVQGTTVELESLAVGLTTGRSVVVSGLAVDDPGRTVRHLSGLAEVTHDFGAARSTTLTLASALPMPLLRETVTVNANVVRASHGLTRSEVLGSGDGRLPFQQFRLSDQPLTHLSAATAVGRASTLRVFVDDVEWHEVAQFSAQGPDDRVFVARETERGAVVQFGDGVSGARLPTGVANVRAVYRVGAGAAGIVGPDRLTSLAARPPGLAGVTNPNPSEGGAEAETADQARRNVAVNVRTLGRVVSLRDYEDFARSFSGVAKALAVWGRSGGRRGVILTVAGDGGAAIPVGSPIHDSLLEALAGAGDDLVPVHLLDHRPRRFRVAADLRIHADHQPAIVRPAVEAAVHDAFSYDRRALGQPVFASEILAVIHGVRGVVAADLTRLGIVTDAGAGVTVPSELVAAAPPPGSFLSDGSGAELLTVEPHPLSLGDLP